MRSRWHALWRYFRQTALLMVGVPDYEGYLRHMREHHPDHVPLSHADWILRSQEARYGGKKTGKCPC